MFRHFFVRPWIKNGVLNYLFDKEKYQKTPIRVVRAQVMRVSFQFFLKVHVISK
jgi:hypothetical protein